MSAQVEDVLVTPLQHRARIKEAADMHIGQVLRRAGKLDEGDIRRVLSVQGTEEIRFGDAAVKLGLVDRHDVQHALAQQFAYPCLRGADSLLSPRLVAAFDPYGASAEGFRRLRTQLSMRWFSQHKTLAVTSARPDEGASLVAANLAIVFAQIGIRTLLIDANLRMPWQHRLFGTSGDIGLSTLLGERASLEEIIAPVDGLEGLLLISAGSIPPNPQELLERGSFVRALKWCANSYDVVILDSPPLLECADTQTIASRTGGCLLSMRRHQSRLADVAQVRSLLQPASATLVGSVLCD